MKVISTEEASNNLNKLIKEISLSHEPIQINGDKIDGVLLSKDDCESIEETLYLISIPGMKDSIIKEIKTPLKDCSIEID